MRKLLLALVCLLPLLSPANNFIIDETKSDIYFANSILTTEIDSQRYLDDIVSKKIRIEQYNGSFTKMDKELNFDINYNQTHGYYGDWYDTYMLLSSQEDGWKTLNNIMDFVFDKGLGKGIDKATKLAKLSDREKELLEKFMELVDLGSIRDFFSEDRTVDLSRQIAKFRDSIRHGHSVVVLAHGKGDIFTAQAYKEMLKPDSLNGENYRENAWLKNYFHWISIGSPSKDRAEGQPHVGFDSQQIVLVPHVLHNFILKFLMIVVLNFKQLIS